MSSRQILVGVFGAPHGIRGELRLKSYTEEPVGIAKYGALASEDGRQSFTIEAARPLKDGILVVRVKGVQDRTAAERLTNIRLFVDRARLPAAGDDEFYHADLVDLRAETEEGRALGRVVSLQNFGAGDMLEIAPPVGDTIFVPFTKAFVPVVDLGAGRLVITEAAMMGEDNISSEAKD